MIDNDRYQPSRSPALWALSVALEPPSLDGVDLLKVEGIGRSLLDRLTRFLEYPELELSNNLADSKPSIPVENTPSVPTQIVVSIDVKFEGGDRPVINGQTNLPDCTELIRCI